MVRLFGFVPQVFPIPSLWSMILGLVKAASSRAIYLSKNGLSPRLRKGMAVRTATGCAWPSS
eukprot:611604-Pyramimonas_sp.AAC.1